LNETGQWRAALLFEQWFGCLGMHCKAVWHLGTLRHLERTGPRLSRHLKNLTYVRQATHYQIGLRRFAACCQVSEVIQDFFDKRLLIQRLRSECKETTSRLWMQTMQTMRATLIQTTSLPASMDVSDLKSQMVWVYLHLHIRQDKTRGACVHPRREQQAGGG
jgi:hypothetical protein